MSDDDRLDVAVVGAGPAGIGIGVALSKLDVDFEILERDQIGAALRRWPDEMRFITPSFPSNSFGLTDLNAITPNSSPAYTLDSQQPSGDEYADYLEATVEFFDLPVRTGIDVQAVSRSADAVTSTDTADERAEGAADADSSASQGTPAVDGGSVVGEVPGPGDRAEIGGPQTAEDGDEGFVLETSEGQIESRFVVWAGGHFGNPRRDVFPGSELCIHTSEVRSWTDHAAASNTDQFLIIGGYESGIDAAVALAEAGATARVLDRSAPWAIGHPDPSETLAPYTMERIDAVADTGRLQVAGGLEVTGVTRDEDGCFEVQTQPVDDYQLGEPDAEGPFTVPTQPILATGYQPHFGPVDEYFPRDDGVVQLTERDESPDTPGLFLAGPEVTHNDVKFCFIYKFRARFPVVAETIGDRLGVDTDPLEEYREQNMFLEDLSCCEAELCEC